MSWPMACSSLKAAWEAAMISPLRPSTKAQLVEYLEDSEIVWYFRSKMQFVDSLM
jgi:hypothetical protein